MQIINRKYELIAPGTIIEKELEISNSLEPDQLLVKVKRITLCGSDFKLFHGGYNAPSMYPIVIGHEWSGEIVKTGKSVRDFTVGDLVTGDCSRYCDKCENCNKDKNQCINITKFGITTSGYCQKYKVVEGKYLYKVTGRLNEKNAALVECFSVAFSAIKKSRLDSLNMKVLVIGGGPIGLAITRILKEVRDIRHVDVLETDKKRVTYVKNEINEINFIDSETLSLNGSESYDLVFESSGSIQGFDNALTYAKKLGEIVCVGFYPKGEFKNISCVVTKSITIQGSIGGTGSFKEVIQLFENNPDITKSFISEEFPIEYINTILENKFRLKDHIKLQLFFNS